jgi:hypothetical protein
MQPMMDDEERSWSLIHASDDDDAPRDQAIEVDVLTPPSLDYAANNFGNDGEEEHVFETCLMGGSGPTILVQSSGMDPSLVNYGVVAGGVLDGTTDINAIRCWSMDDDLEMLDDEPMAARPKSFLFQEQSASVMACNHNWMNTPMTSDEWDRIRDEETAEVALSRHRQRTRGETKEGEQSIEKPWALSHWTSTAWGYDESH